MTRKFFWFALIVSISSASEAAELANNAQPIRPLGECLVSQHVRNWGVVDDRRLVVESLGERYYDIQLSRRCPDLRRKPYLAFREGMQPLPLGSARGYRPMGGMDPVTSDGRVCGDIGDAIVPRSGGWNGTEIPCGIENIRRINANLFHQVFDMDPAAANRLLDAKPTPTVTSK